MAFSGFGIASNAAMGSPSSAGLNVQTGPELEEILTQALGFKSLEGESKVQLLPSPWPTDKLPPPTSSLLSVASHKGLVAAAGPDAVIIATTESVRKAFFGEKPDAGNFRPFQPQLTLPMPMRISQVAFSSDETYLVLSAEEGGGLAVYEVQALLQGSTQSAFQVPTNGQALRALIPNPKAERGEFIAVVTREGNLMMGNLKEKNFVSGPNGQVLKDGVSCISWSTQGKQLVAGLGNGTVFQMKPDGTGTGEIPAPPNSNGYHVSSITWLENHVFLLAHTPSNSDSSQQPDSIFHVVTRTPPSSYTFQKIADPTTPFGLERFPQHHFLLRLKDFQPNLQDLVIVASSASTDIGLFSRSKVPLSTDKPADKITGVFTSTGMSDDSRRAQLPMTGSMDDTAPIGIALDLSSTEKVVGPIPGDELDESSGPLPALLVLNNEGVLAAWWIVYTESIRQGTTYPGLVVAEGTAPPAQTQTSAQPAQSPFGASSSQPAFGQSTFGTPSSSAPAFGSASKVGAFGAPSGLGQSKSVWGTPSTGQSSGSAFGAPAFGSAASSTAPATTNTPTFGSSTFGTPSSNSAPGSAPAFGAPAFGQTSTPAFGNAGLSGNRPSPWGSTGAGATSIGFGQTSGLGKPTGIFGAPSTGTTPTQAPSSGGFAGFASKGGFAATSAPAGGSIFGSTPASPSPASGGSVFSATKENTPTTNVFGAKPTSPAPSTGLFGKPASPAPGTSSIFGGSSQPTTSVFGAPSGSKTSIGFGGSSGAGNSNKPELIGSGNFILGSTFKADPSAKGDNEKPSGEVGKSLFGGGFGSALGEVAKSPPATAAVSKEADMDSEETVDVPKPPKPEASSSAGSTTPISTPAPPKFASPAPGPSLFGSSTTPATKPFSTPGFSFGKPSGQEDSAKSIFGQSTIPVPAQNTPVKPSIESPFSRVKKEPESDQASVGKDIPEAPLPPDPTSKTSDTSVSSTEPDAPLPPDFIPRVAKPAEPPTPTPEIKTSRPTTTPSDLIPPSDVPGGPDEENDSADFLTEDEEESNPSGEEDESEEGSGEDVTKDLSPQSNDTAGITPQSSFGFGNQSPAGGLFTNIQRPKQSNTKGSLFGEINLSAPSLPPPKPLASPRSPSPVRTAASRLQRPDASRSVSAPGVASQLLGPRAGPIKPSVPSQQSLAFALKEQQAEEKRRAELRKKKEDEEKQALIDNEDEENRIFLASDIEGTTKLHDFEAHADYVGKEPADSIPAQIETLYRDINSMIDTLGINARYLKSFIKGHTEQYKEEGRSREDLNDEENWVLVEVEDLGVLVEKSLTRELEDGRVREVAAKVEACADLEKEISRIRAKHEDIKKILGSHSDPDHIATIRAQPLSAEQAAQQHDLRKQFMNFQELLAKAEEEVTVLKAALASQSGRSNGTGGPTVEAVIKTIAKMTSMAEKRSGDIDLLENQMRRLRFGSVASPGSREGSPFATPQNKASLRTPGSSGTYGLYFTPDSSIRESNRNFQNSLMSSTSSFARGSPGPRKKMSGFSAEEKAELRVKLARRKNVKDRLRAALQKSGTNVRLMDDDE